MEHIESREETSPNPDSAVRLSKLLSKNERDVMAKSRQVKKREATLKATMNQVHKELSYVAPTTITKEICEDVYLTKELVYPPGRNPFVNMRSEEDEAHLSQVGGFQMVFRLTNDSLKEVTFMIDWRDSMKCEWSANPNDIQQ